MAEPEKPIEVSAFEPKDLGEGFIWGVVGLCVAVLLGCALIVVWLYPSAIADRIISGAPPGYPEPRLQADPVADLRRFHAQELERLNGTGWIDRSQGIVHIPIDTAMQQIAAEGITDWPAP
jgi:hypothetical protein